MMTDELRTLIESHLKQTSLPIKWSLANALPLSVIGCWTGGPARWFVKQFSTVLGGDVPVRDVGVTASEGYFAIPLSSDWDGGVLWNHGELLEFQDDTGSVYWGWELEQGKEYSLIISARNGLLRYAMLIVYESLGFMITLPLLPSLAKKDGLSMPLAKR